ncbi:hypothetical protein I4U23_010778 [Adineta vaga]|nr:hypothetical protein I4U23_010778 [Adineta vaga]
MAARAGLSATWLLVGSVCLAIITLASIVVVVVLSLLPLYLPRKGDDITVGNYAEAQRAVNLVFATDLTNSPQGTISNYNSLARQMNQRLGYSQDILSVRSAIFANSAVTNNNRKKKRQTGVKISCDAVRNGTNEGANLGMYVHINKCPRSKCLTDQCLEKCVPETKSEIQSKLGSTSYSFDIETTNETILVTIQFCILGQVTSATTTTTAVPTILEAPFVNCTYSGSSTCGCSPIKPTFLTPKIINGYLATPNSWPWVVLVEVSAGDFTEICGGFLITYEYVITAGHCVPEGLVTEAMLTVYAGIRKRSEKNNGQIRSVLKINRQPLFNATVFTNDIAVLKLASAVTETSLVGLCCLPTDTSLPVVGGNAVIVGWGRTTVNGSQPDELQQAVVKILPPTSSCVASSDVQFCAGYMTTDTCRGDSGGPVMISSNNLWTCAGSVSSSLGVGCNGLGAYTRIVSQQSFIQSVIKS